MTTTSSYKRSQSLFAQNAGYIAGSTVSLNRLVEPRIAFARGQGSSIWDVDDHHYIDYHGAFGPHILGHNHPEVNAAVIRSLQNGESLFGSGTNAEEGELSKLIVDLIPSIDLVQLTTTGSEATYHAVRLARAFTGRRHLVVMQGGYNGWHNDVAANVMNPVADLGPRKEGDEYRVLPLSAGIPQSHTELIHPVNYNDLASVEAMFRKYDVACIILEPVLQNIGVVPPKPGYLQGLRALCDRYGVVLIFDEVKTGFRAALQGYQSIAGVRPDLTTFGKAIANGYPLGVIGGRKEIMELFAHPDPIRRVMIAGTYNAHPVSLAAGIATIKTLAADDGALFGRLEKRTHTLTKEIDGIFAAAGIPAVTARVGSAFCTYFMEQAPTDWHSIALHHDAKLDNAYRRAMIDEGIYHFPLASKQSSVSAAHSDADFEKTIEATRTVVNALAKARRAG